MNNYKNLKKPLIIIGINKVLMILITFIITSLIYQLLGKENYGTYMALFSLFSWIMLFDLGISKGMRNYLTTALSKHKYVKSAYYISTTYVSIFFITIALFVLLTTIIYFFPLGSFLNITNLSNSEVSLVLFIFTIAFLIKFFLGIINQIFYASHNSQKTSIYDTISNFLFLILLVFAYAMSYNKASIIALLFTMSVLIIHVYSTFSFFKTNNKIIPRFSYFSKKVLSNILGSGTFLFLIQISFILIIGLDRIILQKYGSSILVSDYDILYKVMSIIILPIGIILQPLWASFNEAYTKKDFKWISDTFKKLYLIVFLTLIIMLIVGYFFNTITILWLNNSFEHISFFNILMMGAILICLVWSNLHTDFLVATNNFRIVLLFTVFSILIKYLYLIFCHVDKISLSEILTSTALSYFIYSVNCYIYTKKIIKEHINE